jgi:hypothetical protein
LYLITSSFYDSQDNVLGLTTDFYGNAKTYLYDAASSRSLLGEINTPGNVTTTVYDAASRQLYASSVPEPGSCILLIGRGLLARCRRSKISV